MKKITPLRDASLFSLIKEMFLLPAFLVIGLISCKKSVDSGPPIIDSASTTTPTLTTKVVSTITQYSAWSGGSVSSDASAPVTARGICWSLNPGPTTADSKTSDSIGTGSYRSIITGLLPNTKYYLRAYGKNKNGTGYGVEVSFTTLEVSDSSVTDIDGNVYSVVTIGSQVWMKENLKTTHYRNGDPIPTGLDNARWGSTTSGAYAIYNNDPVNDAVYGKLYNWFAAGDSRNIAPVGWHIPTESERTELIMITLGGLLVAGGEMKEAGLTHWAAPNLGATNNSGFTGLPGGNRANTGDYFQIGSGGFWWTITDYPGYSEAEALGLWYGQTDAGQISGEKAYGLSIRCIRD